MGRGFTLIEWLIAVGVVGFLAAAVLVAVEPVKRVQDTRDEQRLAQVARISGAIAAKRVADGRPYAGVPAPQGAPVVANADFAQVIVRDAAGVDCANPAKRPGCDQPLDAAHGTSCVADFQDLADGADSLVPKYLPELPLDPRGTNGPAFCGAGSGCRTVGELPLGEGNSGYYVRKVGDLVEVGACRGEQNAAAGAIAVRQ